MLKIRLITAAILIPLFIFFVLKASPQIFCLVTGILVLWAAFEWSQLMGVNTFPQKLFYPLFIFVILIASLALPITHVLYVAFFWWLMAAMLVIFYPKTEIFLGRGIGLRALMGILVLMPCWLALNWIRVSCGPYVLLALFILIWGADSAAYFVGRKWGKNKLLPLVSPGKSWQGLFGALVVTLIIVSVPLVVLKIPYAIWPNVFLLSILTVLFSVLGDLFESMLKRHVGIKDSGQLLPGHGGFLDRIDSLTAAAPIFALGITALCQYY